MGWGKYLLAVTVIVGITAGLEQYDIRLAYGFAILTLLALFFRYPQSVRQIEAMFRQGLSPLPKNERT